MNDQMPFGEYKMPFGKFKGQPIAGLPAWYVIWLHDEVNLDRWGIRRAVELRMKELRPQRPARP